MRLLLLSTLLLLQAVISVKTELVAVPVTVTDAHGRRITGLTQDAFRVREDGRPQPIVVFHHGDAPVTIGLIVDRSRSMRRKDASLHLAISALLQSARADDELFGIGFSDGVAFARSPSGGPFARDARELAASLDMIPAGGMTALYDGVADGLQHLQVGTSGKRALIVLSDGGDNASRRTYPDILALARRSDAVIYALGLLNDSPGIDEEDDRLLKRLCKDTGGVAYFPRTTEAIAAMSTEIARDLREQYTLGFTPDDRSPGRAFRTIDVAVVAPGYGRLHLRTRSGYSRETP